jgi:hypothetical protein
MQYACTHGFPYYFSGIKKTYPHSTGVNKILNLRLVGRDDGNNDAVTIISCTEIIILTTLIITIIVHTLTQV